MKISKHKLPLAIGLLLSGAIQIAGNNADMPSVLQYVKQSQKYTGGEAIYLDCDEGLRKHYEKYGFEYLQPCDYDKELIQMIKAI